jgi:phosphoglycolate phosphatase
VSAASPSVGAALPAARSAVTAFAAPRSAFTACAKRARSDGQSRRTVTILRVGALIFDLDGTLSDPAVGIGRSLNYALDALGYRCLTTAEVCPLVGAPLDWAFRQVVPDASDDTVLALVAKYRERYGDIGYAENLLYPGIAEALTQLSADSVRMGVCTSKRVDFAERILDMFGLRGHFSFVSGGDVGVAKRAQLRTLVEQHEVARTSIMIGDRAVDIEAARANGLAAVGVLWGYGAGAELLAAAPDRILRSPAELVFFGHQL